MSVLFKNMGIPVDCRDCPFEMFYNYCGETRCLASNEILAVDYMAIPFSGRPDWCPIIELPPHGDLIDRDALSKSLDDLCDRVCQYSKAQRKVMCSACPLGDAFAVVEDDAPAIIEAEEGK